MTETPILTQMFNDIMDGIEAHFGKEGLAKVVEHCRSAERARKHNAEIDELEAALTAGK
jgi:hypothetical protein